MKSWKLLQTQTKTAEQITRELGFIRLPIDPFKIAEKNDIIVKGGSLTGCKGCLMLHDNQFGIVYSDTLSNKGFINFTVAHELGHYFIEGHPELLFPDGKGMHKSQNDFTSGESHEREADSFAAGLLMPENMFLPAMNKAGMGVEAIKTMSELCNTSLTSTAIRFASLAEYPAAVIFSSDEKVDFCVLSEDLKPICREWNIKNNSVDKGTTTGKFYRSPENIAMCSEKKEYCQLSDWFDCRRDIEINEDVIGLGGYNKVLTVLFHEDSIEIEEDSEDDYIENPSFH